MYRDLIAILEADEELPKFSDGGEAGPGDDDNGAAGSSGGSSGSSGGSDSSGGGAGNSSGYGGDSFGVDDTMSPADVPGMDSFGGMSSGKGRDLEDIDPIDMAVNATPEAVEAYGLAMEALTEDRSLASMVGFDVSPTAASIADQMASRALTDAVATMGVGTKGTIGFANALEEVGFNTFGVGARGFDAIGLTTPTSRQSYGVALGGFIGVDMSMEQQFQVMQQAVGRSFSPAEINSITSAQLEGFKNGVVGIGKGFATGGIAGALGGMLGNVVGQIDFDLPSIPGLTEVQNAVKSVSQAVHSITDPISQAVHSITDPISQEVQSAVNSVKDSVRGITDPIGASIANSITDPISNSITDALGTTAGQVTSGRGLGNSAAAQDSDETDILLADNPQAPTVVPTTNQQVTNRGTNPFGNKSNISFTDSNPFGARNALTKANPFGSKKPIGV